MKSPAGLFITQLKSGKNKNNVFLFIIVLVHNDSIRGVVRYDAIQAMASFFGAEGAPCRFTVLAMVTYQGSLKPII